MYQERQDTYSFDNSYIKEWLNTRFYHALPADWQSIITDTYIPTTSKDGQTNIVSLDYTPSKFWIPSMVELLENDSSTKEIPFSNEGVYKVIYAESDSKRITRGIATVELFSTNAE